MILRLLSRQLYSTIPRRPKSAPRTSLVLIKEVPRFLKPLEIRSAPLYAGMNADEAPDLAHYHRRTANGFGSAGRRIMLPLVWEGYRRLAPRQKIRSHENAMLDARLPQRLSLLPRQKRVILLTYAEHMTSHISLPLRPPPRFSTTPVVVDPVLLGLHPIPVIIALRLWPTHSCGVLRKGGQEWMTLQLLKRCASWTALAAGACGLVLPLSASTARAVVALALPAVN